MLQQQRTSRTKRRAKQSRRTRKEQVFSSAASRIYASQVSIQVSTLGPVHARPPSRQEALPCRSDRLKRAGVHSTRVSWIANRARRVLDRSPSPREEGWKTRQGYRIGGYALLVSRVKHRLERLGFCASNFDFFRPGVHLHCIQSRFLACNLNSTLVSHAMLFTWIGKNLFFCFFANMHVHRFE